MMFKIILILCVVIFPVRAVFSQEAIVCPGDIAAIENNPLSQSVSLVLKDVYLETGCELNVQFLPARRGVSSFNNHKVDGEVYRLILIEPSYEREFVRSSVHLLSIINAVYRHPDETKQGRFPYGFQIGVKWTEEYSGYDNMLGFSSYKEMYEAYNEGRLAGVLGTQSTINLLVSNGKFKLAPIRDEILSEASIYHYLDAKYAPFMDQLSMRIRDGDYFSSLN